MTERRLRVHRCTVGICQSWVSELDGVSCCQSCGAVTVEGVYDCRLSPNERRLLNAVLHQPGIYRNELIVALWPNPDDEPDMAENILSVLKTHINQKSRYLRVFAVRGPSGKMGAPNRVRRSYLPLPHELAA